MNGAKLHLIFFLIAGLALAASSCARQLAPPSFVKPEMDLSLIRRVAVLPLDNLTREQNAHEKVRRLLIAELLASGAFEIVDPGEVNRALAELGAQAAVGIKLDEIKRLGRRLTPPALALGAG